MTSRTKIWHISTLKENFQNRFYKIFIPLMFYWKISSTGKLSRELSRKTGPKSPCHILMVILVWQAKIGVPGIEMSHFIKIHKETHFILSDFLDLLKNIEKRRRYPQLSDHHGFRLQIGDIYLFYRSLESRDRGNKSFGGFSSEIIEGHSN